MRIKKLSITGWMGIPDLTLNLGSVNLLTGRNSASKSSVIEAIKALLSHEHEPSRIRKGSKDARVEMQLDNGHTYKMKTTEKSTVWDFKDDKGNPIRRTAELLAGLLNRLSLDPLEFIRLEPKKQALAFTKAVPSRVTQEALGVPDIYCAGIDFDQHALSVIGDERSGVYGRIYEKRTEVNRATNQSRQTAQNLEASLGELGLDASESNLRVAISAAEAEKEAINAAKLAMIAEANAEYDRAKDVALKIRDAAHRNIDTVWAEPLEAVSNKISELRKTLENVNKVVQTKRIVEQEYAKAKAGVELSEVLTNYLDRLKVEKTALVKASPIPGLEVGDDGKLYYEGVEFGVLNLAKQFEIAIKVAQLSAGDLGLILVDNMEHFDTENFNNVLREMELAANKNGLQFVCARVTDDEELKIETGN